MIVQAHAVSGQSQGGDGVQKAGGQAAQTAVAQGGLRLHGLQHPQVPAHSGQIVLHRLIQPQGQQLVGQQLAQQELRREVIELPLPRGGGALPGALPGQDKQGLIQLPVVALVGGPAEVLLGQLENFFT